MAVQKSFTEKEVKKKIKKVLNKYEKQVDNFGPRFSMNRLLNDYQFNSRNRFIKEVLFYNSDTSGQPYGTWRLRHPRTKAKRLAKIVMNTVNIF